MHIRFKVLKWIAFVIPESLFQKFLPFNIELIQSSFAPIRPRIFEYSPVFYDQYFFKDYPEVVPLFGRNMPRAELDTRINAFMLFIVDNANRPRTYLPFIEKLAARHRQYGIKIHQYDFVCEANIKTLKYFLGNQWTDEIEKEWRKAFGFLAQFMKWAGGFS